jgi:hypothetical protein
VTHCRANAGGGDQNGLAMQRWESRFSRAWAGSIDYEPTSLHDARAAHDQLPPGVDEFGRMQPGYWEQRRRLPLPTDRALTGLSLEWLINLPQELRPEALRDRYPRIVNSLSEAWADDARVVALFEHLLHDPRPGRKGFPPDVRQELELLCAYRVELITGPPPAPAPADADQGIDGSELR